MPRFEDDAPPEFDYYHAADCDGVCTEACKKVRLNERTKVSSPPPKPLKKAITEFKIEAFRPIALLPESPNGEVSDEQLTEEAREAIIADASDEELAGEIELPEASKKLTPTKILVCRLWVSFLYKTQIARLTGLHINTILRWVNKDEGCRAYIRYLLLKQEQEDPIADVRDMFKTSARNIAARMIETALHSENLGLAMRTSESIFDRIGLKPPTVVKADFTHSAKIEEGDIDEFNKAFEENRRIEEQALDVALKGERMEKPYSILED